MDFLNTIDSDGGLSVALFLKRLPWTSFFQRVGMKHGVARFQKFRPLLGIAPTTPSSYSPSLNRQQGGLLRILTFDRATLVCDVKRGGSKFLGFLGSLQGEAHNMAK
ncbi:MAG: hypothetical protein B0A82_17465, partial [Alkalinema sp. CACIAM 70d]